MIQGKTGSGVPAVCPASLGDDVVKMEQMMPGTQHGCTTPSLYGRRKKKLPLLKRKQQNRKSTILNNFEMFKLELFHVTPSNFKCLILKAASPGPEVSVPTLGSWKYDDLICKIQENPPGGFFPSVYGILAIQSLQANENLLFTCFVMYRK